LNFSSETQSHSLIFSRKNKNLFEAMKKIIWGIVIGILVLIIVVAIGVGLFIGPIVKTGIETIGPKITKVSINVDAVDISLLTGSAKVKNFIVGNPDGYKTTNAISIGTAAIGVNPFSVFSDKIVVRSIHVESPEITFQGGLGGNNLSKLMDNVNGTAQQGGPVSTNAAGQPKPSKKIEVDDFLITGAKVHGTLILFGSREVTLPSLPIPDIHLTDLGTGADGLTATELTRAVLNAITSATIKAVASDATDIGKNLGNVGQNAGKAAADSVNKISKSLGGLFGK
jgi:hypothetical protein